MWLVCFYDKLPSPRGLGVYQPWNCWICWNLLRISKTLSNNCRGLSVAGSVCHMSSNFSNVHHTFWFPSDKFQECLVHSDHYHVDQRLPRLTRLPARQWQESVLHLQQLGQNMALWCRRGWDPGMVSVSNLAFTVSKGVGSSQVGSWTSMESRWIFFSKSHHL